jgi:4-carboxymuconolactone decarboxylase
MTDGNQQQPRISLVNATTHPDLLGLIDSVKQQRGGSFLNLYAALANSPLICAGWLQLFTSIRQQSSVPAHLRELAMLRVAVLNRAPYEFDAHVPFARAAGVSDIKIEALRDIKLDVALFESFEAAVLGYTDAMTLRIQVRDDEFLPVKQVLSDQTLLELTVTIAGYNMVSRVLEALHIPHEPAQQADN